MLLSFAPSTKLNVSNGLVHHFPGNFFELQFLNVPNLIAIEKNYIDT